MALPIIGTIIDRVIDKGASLISEFVTDKDQAARLEHEWRQQLSRENHEIAKLALEIERDINVSQQATIQAELHQSDLYTKRTRPKIARQSWYIAGAYAMLAAVMPALPIEWGFGTIAFGWEIFIALAAPAMTYMGVRTVDLGISRIKGIK
jgi:hypothetical protein